MDANIAGMIAKYFATSLAIEKVVSEPRVISNCFADGHDFDQLGRIAVEIHHVAGFFRRHGSRVHGHADIRLSQRRSIVCTVTGHRHEAALRLFLLDVFQLVLRSRLREEVVHAGFLRDGSGGQRIVAGDHHRANSHGAQRSKPLLHSTLDDVL